MNPKRSRPAIRPLGSTAELGVGHMARRAKLLRPRPYCDVNGRQVLHFLYCTVLHAGLNIEIRLGF